MKRTHLLTVVATIAIFIANASAYYHPTLGRWLSRDPGPGSPSRVGTAGPTAGGGFAKRDPVGNQYADGMNLYQCVRSAPTIAVDPFGLWSVVVVLPKNRALVGKLHLYNDKLRLILVSYPARGQGGYVNRAKKISKPWWQRRLFSRCRNTNRRRSSSWTRLMPPWI